MYKISDFSRLCQVSPKTLRYYDEVGLLKPASIDPFTAYRYYEISQLPRLNRILALKDLGFRLDQIGSILDEGLSSEQIRGMLRLKQAEVQQDLDDSSSRLRRIDNRLKQIEQEGCLTHYDVLLKQVDVIPVISLRGLVADPLVQNRLWVELFQFISEQGAKPVGPCISLYHDLEYPEQDWDIEVCQAVTGDIHCNDRIRNIVLPAVSMMATTIHHGDAMQMPLAYRALLDWISANGYRICGPGRDVGWQTSTDAVIEAQFPV